MSNDYFYSEVQGQIERLYTQGNRMSPEGMQTMLLNIRRNLIHMVETMPQPRRPTSRRPTPLQTLATLAARQQTITSRRSRSAKHFEKIKALSKKESIANCTDACAICRETHQKIDSIITECSHEFGKTCYAAWMLAPQGNQCCPTCRKECPNITSFRPRAKRTTQN